MCESWLIDQTFQNPREPLGITLIEVKGLHPVSKMGSHPGHSWADESAALRRRLERRHPESKLCVERHGTHGAGGQIPHRLLALLTSELDAAVQAQLVAQRGHPFAVPLVQPATGD